jgi:acyl-coenzyme A synthetase/AMP-(fatty) acid ligase
MTLSRGPDGGLLPSVPTDAMPSFPLLSHASGDQTIAWRDGVPVPATAFLADVMRVARALPAGGHVLNLCADRYRFAVGLCATLVTGRTSLLPSAHTPEALRQLAAFAPDVHCLHDRASDPVALPCMRYPDHADHTDHADGAGQVDQAAPHTHTAHAFAVPQIDAAQTVAWLFTSGSTGAPVPHRKTWGELVRCLRGSAGRLGLHGLGACTLIGTVPPQHMYGFENTVLLALVGGFAFSNRQPFYPGDLAAELAGLPQPRVLVTSPVHLRALMLSAQPLPPVALTVSATAPLAPALARDAEARLGAPLVEIYGSTESGQIATRRTAREAAWTLYPGIRIDLRAGTPESGPQAWVSGAHVDPPVPMGDVIEPLDDVRFLLHGRIGDLINIAGKRTSLGYLNHQLNAIPGVVDGVFFMPDEPACEAGEAGGDPVTRLAAFVVAPQLDAVRLQRALRERIDAAFMPRPLCFVDALPRNETGKLPRDALRALFAQRGASAATPPLPASPAPLGFTIEAGHPALAGHFPGYPIVPGVVLLDHAIAALGRALDRPTDAFSVSAAKFLRPARPGERLDVAYDTSASGALRFTITRGAQTVASGTLRAAAPAGAAPRGPAVEAS